jgi:DNA mismatch repair protein MutS
MRQYVAAKDAHPDALVFFRLGDFYELFWDDAITAARELDLTLTSRNKGAADEVPMAGIPHHAASAYVQKLVERGFSIALCEQMADPSTCKGIVPREVVRVVSPAMPFDDAGVVAREELLLAGLVRGAGGIAVVTLDATTGELRTTHSADDATILAELTRLEPRELIANAEAAELAATVKSLRPRVVLREAQVLGSRERAELFRALPDVADIAGDPLREEAAAYVLAQAQRAEGGKLPHVGRVVGYALTDTLVLDETTQAHLELVRTLSGGTDATLLARLDRTVTSPGARLLRRRLLAPSTDLATVRRRHDLVELFVSNGPLRRDLRGKLGAVADLERLATKCQLGRANPRDLLLLARSVAALPDLAATLEAAPDLEAHRILAEGDERFEREGLETFPALADSLVRAVSPEAPARLGDAPTILEGFDAELDRARRVMNDGTRMLAELEARLRESTGVGSLKVRFTRVFGWYIEVTKSNLDRVPKEWRRKQTVASGERFVTDELEKLADEVAHAEETSAKREEVLFSGLVSEVARSGNELRRVAAVLARWDVAAALAEVAVDEGWVRPEVDESLSLELLEARHPVVEALAARGRFVPNDVHLDAAACDAEAPRLWLVTGPNMAGKSTFLRQVALCTLLAQMGAYVPAARARIGLVDRVLTRVGASDNLARGESTFMVEMKETAQVLRRASRRSLVVLDEIGRGTSTYDGLSIAWAVAEHLDGAIGCRALFATHYHELTELEKAGGGVANYSVQAREQEGDIVFLHRLQRGAASRSYGVACARLAGLPEPVLARAQAVLAELEAGPRTEAPTPAPAAGKRGAKAATPQLDLFAAPAVSAGQRSALDTLAAVDVDRLTPLDALQLVARLRELVRP